MTTRSAGDLEGPNHDPPSFTAAALITAIAEAGSRIALGDSSHELMLLVRHCREMHDLLLQAILEREPEVPEFVRGLAEKLGAHVKDLEIAGAAKPMTSHSRAT
jgi:hypothetical protein